jgi:hypothetical protein
VESYIYFNAGWRVAEKLEHYPVKCDFYVESVAYILEKYTAVPESDEEKLSLIRDRINVISRMQVTLVKKRGDLSLNPPSTTLILE